jgi:hypothetical protein
MVCVISANRPFDKSFWKDYYLSCLDGLVIGHVSVSSLYSQNWDNSFKDYIDNFSISTIAPVPEPETYALILAGLGLIGFIRRRKQKASA